MGGLPIGVFGFPKNWFVECYPSAGKIELCCAEPPL